MNLSAAQSMSKRFKIADRGFLLFSIPIVFVLAFFWQLVEIQRLNEQAQLWSLHSQDVTSQSDNLLRSLADVENDVNRYLLTGKREDNIAYSHAVNAAHESCKNLE